SGCFLWWCAQSPANQSPPNLLGIYSEIGAKRAIKRHDSPKNRASAAITANALNSISGNKSGANTECVGWQQANLHGTQDPTGTFCEICS
ncbi:hypothetical protein, partial [Mesorhizobium marinum]|uniref:hypothetical protein n=1 Tax=Mesorhizobium marinum TaxID=3228790 RepID=UPI0034677F5A